MLLFINHSKEGFRLAKMVVKVRVFGEFRIEFEDILECFGVTEMQLSTFEQRGLLLQIPKALTVLGPTRTTGPAKNIRLGSSTAPVDLSYSLQNGRR
jgi:hypothetical protein